MPDAILYEHDDGRWAVNPVTTGDPGWHRVGPIDVSALASAPAAEITDEMLDAGLAAPVPAVMLDSLRARERMVLRTRIEAALRAASRPQAQVVAWEYQNQYGRKFLSSDDPNKWHPHDQEGFKNFRALTYAAATPEPVGYVRAMDLPIPKEKGALVFSTSDADWNIPVYAGPVPPPEQEGT